MLSVQSFQHSHLMEIDSTNAELLRRAARSDVHRCALSANAQTAGRGQRGRRWIARPGEAVLLSLAWRFHKTIRLDGLSLAVGVTVAEVLQSFTEQRVALKWPNDVLAIPALANDSSAKKLGGILIETVASSAAAPIDSRVAVIGIGINLVKPTLHEQSSIEPAVNNAPSAVAPAGLAAKTTASATTEALRDSIIAALLTALSLSLERFEQHGFYPFKAAWWQLRAFEAQWLNVIAPDGSSFVGRMAGITETGGLIIESKSGRHTLVSGEISLRPHGDSGA
jgi:biotin-[acetyl-CoA-carboxylase] ligase BirA-like protein